MGSSQSIAGVHVGDGDTEEDDRRQSEQEIEHGWPPLSTSYAFRAAA
jgi:hypothetical protein